MKIMDFDNENSLNDIIDNDTMSDDEVVASYGPPRSLFGGRRSSNELVNNVTVSHDELIASTLITLAFLFF